MSDLRPLSATISQLTSATFSKKFVSLGRILNLWDDIVGSEMAVKAQPAKIHYRKPKEKGERPQATLDIAVSSADAAVLHYQKDLILERINQLFGDKWVTGIRFVHRAHNGNENDASDINSLPRLSEGEKANLKASLTYIDDEEIRNRLEKLGQSVLRKERANAKPSRTRPTTN